MDSAVPAVPAPFPPFPPPFPPGVDSAPGTPGTPGTAICVLVLIQHRRPCLPPPDGSRPYSTPTTRRLGAIRVSAADRALAVLGQPRRRGTSSPTRLASLS